MTETWREFLEGQGLTIGPDGHSHTSSENIDTFQELTGDTLCDLSHTTQVSAGGDDAEDFLQNQLTNDLQSLGKEESLLAGYCNAKGRLICIFRIWRNGDGFLIQMPRDIHEASIDRLRKYVLRAKVQFSADREPIAFGICGKTAAKGLESIIGRLPKRENALTRGDDFYVMRLPGGGRPRFQIGGSISSCTTAWNKLTQHATVGGSWTWARLDILAGIPNITLNTMESFIPQMVNLDLLGVVNFKKGCYPGQEIVARMHYLGNLKQRMARFRVNDEDRPQPGDRVYTQNKTVPTGTVVDAQSATGSSWDLLAVARIADIDRHTLCLKNAHGPVLFQHDLPYSAVAAE